MSDWTLGKTMDDKHPGKPRSHKGVPSLLICWLVAIGFMLLISSNGQGRPASAPAAALQTGTIINAH